LHLFQSNLKTNTAWIHRLFLGLEMVYVVARHLGDLRSTDVV
jgi:hypothetical protein